MSKIRCLGALIVFFGQAAAQETRGSLVGRLIDSSGAVMPAVKITATHASTGTAVGTSTNAEGLYQLPFLLSGTYRVQAEAQGFKTLVRDGIEVRINDRVELNLTMEVGSVGEKIEVVGETPLLQTATASIGQVVDHRRIAELPLMHGNPMAVLELTAGLSQARNSDLGVWGGRVFDNGWTTSYAIDGASSNTHEITLDGVANTTNLGGAGSRNQQTVAFTPPVDIVEEFKVQTASFDASTGYTSGAVINMSVKAGTRDLHGTAYWFKLPTTLAANQWFGNLYGDPKTDYQYNRWGGSMTGPVILPKIYNGREKTFFSWGYEGHHDAPPWGLNATVPTPQMKSGDFSDLLKLSSQYQIYDPATARLRSDGRVERSPFAGNVIPASRISPFTKALLKYWPDPLVAGATDVSNNFPKPNLPDPNRYYSHTARIDHTISSRNRLFGRFAISKNIEKGYRDVFANAASGNNLYRWNRGVTLDDVHTFGATMVVDFRYGYTRFAQTGVPNSAGFNPSEVGFSSSLVAQIDPQAFVFPCFAPSDFTSLGCGSLSDNGTDIHNFSLSGNKMLSAHNLKFGSEARVYRKTGFSSGQATPRLEFGTNYTRGPLDNAAGSPRGQGFASFLLGIPTGGYIDRNASYAAQSVAWAFYLQDDWKLAPKLTVTLGLRYEVEGAVTERYNRTVTGYDFNTPNPIEAEAKANYARSPIAELAPSQFKATGGLLFAGPNSRSIYNAPSNGLMPRIGFAWTATPNTVVRGGYGIFYGYLGVRRADVNQSGFSQRTQIVNSLDNGLTFRVNDLGNPFVDGILNPDGDSMGLRTFLGRSISFFNQNPKVSYMQRFQLSVQRLLPGRILADIGYVGNRGTRLETSRNIDALPNSWLSTSPVRDQTQINFLTAQVPNPFYPLLPGSNIAGTTVSRSQLLLPFPHFTGITTTDYQGFSWYHSLQARVERRFAQGYTLQASYHYSKFMEATGYLNAGDPYPERVISGQDYPQRFSLSAIYELPFGQGKSFLTATSGVASRIVSGWQMQGVYTAQSGQALGFGNAIFTGSLKDIPLPVGDRTIYRWFNTNAGFERNSQRQLANNLRTFNSNFSGVRGDGINQANFSIIKNTTITEGKKVQFRGEALNVFNHVQFGNPNTSPTSGAFGTVTSEKSSARTIQLALKFLF